MAALAGSEQPQLDEPGASILAPGASIPGPAGNRREVALVEHMVESYERAQAYVRRAGLAGAAQLAALEV